MLSDIRHTLRQLAQARGFTIVAVLTLALGLGVNTAMFSLVNTLLFQSAPYPEARQLVRVFRATRDDARSMHSLPNIQDLQAQNSSLTSVAAFQWWSYSLAESGQPAELLNGLAASPELFATIQTQPMLGRSFTPEEQQPGRDRVVILTHDFWQRRFQGNAEIVGATVRIDAQPMTVIGVMPPRFDYPLLWGNIDVIRPLTLANDWRRDRSVHWLHAVARLKPGITLGGANAALESVSAHFAQISPATETGAGLRLEPLHLSATQGAERTLPWFALGLAGFVLLIACANLANLQLARAAMRGRDFAIQSALGASRRRLVAQQLIQTLVLSLVGGGLGILLAFWINEALAHGLQLGNGATAIPINGPVLAFALGLSALTGVIFGLLPAWTASRLDLNTTLKQQSRGSTADRSQHRARQLLIVGEVALALLLLSGAGFFVRGLQRFTQRDPGWRTAGVLTGTITVPEEQYSLEARRTFHRELQRRVGQLPGVDSVALASAAPITLRSGLQPVYAEGRPPDPPGQTPLAQLTIASPSYFGTLGIPLLEGRMFPAELNFSSPRYAVISASTARALWPNQSALGRKLGTAADKSDWSEVIGVVGDVRAAAYDSAEARHLQIYRPLAQDPWAYITIIVRSSHPELLIEPLRRVVAELDPDLPIADLRTVQESINQLQQNFSLINRLLATFAALGLGLAAIGLYGVIAGFVAQRLPEFGIRLALGATPENILRLVLSLGLRLTVAGAALGILGSVGFLRVLAALLPGLPGNDYVAVSLNIFLLLVVSLVACWVPARRATKVDPMIALRVE